MINLNGWRWKLITYLLLDWLHLFFVGQIYHSQDKIQQVKWTEKYGDDKVEHIPNAKSFRNLWRKGQAQETAVGKARWVGT